MSNAPKVSVVVPVYRAEQYLRPCVDSLLCQTLEDIQIILVDDGSPDGCPQICDEYAARDERVEVIHQANGGLLRARIRGTQAARADYVGFLDDDDMADPGLYETLYRAAAEAKAELVCSSFWMFWDSGRREPYAWPFPEGLFCGERLETEFYPHWFEDRKAGTLGLIKSVWCKLFDRALLTDVYTRVAQEVDIGEDLITTFAVAALAERIVTLPDTMLYEYRQSETSMMRNTYWRNFFAIEEAALASLQRMPRRPEATPFLEEGLRRYRAYMLYDILYNECKPNRGSTPAERKAIVSTLTSDPDWRDAAALDVLPEDNTTSRLLRRLILRRRPRLMLAVLWGAVQKNRLLQVMKHGQ